MHEELYPYYEAELTYLRRCAGEFAKRYPEAASALHLETDRSPDPHVERLLEGFALLTGRIRRKLDDEFPELTESLLSLLYPHLLNQIPAAGIAQFRVDPRAVKLTSAYRIPAGTRLSSTPACGTVCHFRTCYPVELVPVTIDSVGIEACGDAGAYGTPCPGARALLTLRLRTLSGLRFGDLSLQRLRVHLHGAPMSYRLYEILGDTVRAVTVGPGDSDGPVTLLRPPAIQPVGFGCDEGLLPCPPRSFIGYRLLQEFFAFPQKFLFFDIVTGDALHALAAYKSLNLHFYLDAMPENARDIAVEHFALGCTPVVNLFEKWIEPFRTDPARVEYRLVPESGKAAEHEIYSVDHVEATDLDTGATRTVEPFYSFRHPLTTEQRSYWYTTRRPGLDGAFETYLTLCSLGHQLSRPPDHSIRVRATCTNRDMTRSMRVHEGEHSDCTAYDIPSFGPIKLITLQRDPIRTPPGREDEYWNGSDDRRYWRGGQWRLISHLSVNYLGLEKGIEPLRALLQLYDMKGTPQQENVILGLVDLDSSSINHLIDGSLCRGIGIELTVDPSRFRESSSSLLSAVLDRFLALYASINSFTRLTVVDNTERRAILKQWPIRTGEQTRI